MGCAPSKKQTENEKSHVAGGTPSQASTSTDVDANDAAERDLLARQPPIPIYVGNGVATFSGDVRSVVFVFGGPGSQKGLLIEELVHEFHFTSINVEDIVFNYLPNKVANTVENIVEIQDLLKRDTALLTVEWILNMISAKLSTSMNQRFVIDIVPSLASILRSASFQSDEHEREMENFERRHPIMFALHLNVPDENSMMSEKAPGSQMNGNGGNKDDDDGEQKKELSPELSAFLKGIDEADKGRLERRLDAYHTCVRPFLNYFQKTKRIVRMDIVSVVREHLIRTMRDMLCDFGFTTNIDSIRVVLFAFNERQVSGLDRHYYRMQRVMLSDIVHDRNESLTAMIRSIRRHINRTSRASQNYLIMLDCLNETDDSTQKRINFIERRHCYLDHYIRVAHGSGTSAHQSKKAPSQPTPMQHFKTPFHAVTSTCAEVCLFPSGFPVDLCKRIGAIFGEKLNISESESLAASRTSPVNAADDQQLPPSAIVDESNELAKKLIHTKLNHHHRRSKH